MSKTDKVTKGKDEYLDSLTDKQGKVKKRKSVDIVL
jgi:hypothetical protein